MFGGIERLKLPHGFIESSTLLRPSVGDTKAKPDQFIIHSDILPLVLDVGLAAELFRDIHFIDLKADQFSNRRSGRSSSKREGG